MKYCDTVQRDYFEVQLLEAKQLYFKKSNLRCAQKLNSLLEKIWEYKGLCLIKKDILTYKRLVDYKIEDHLRKSNIDIF